MTIKDKKINNKFIKDMGAVFTPVFYIFSIVAVASAIIVCGYEWITVLTAVFLILLTACAAADINKGIVPDLLAVLIAILAVVSFISSGNSIQNLIACILGALVLSGPMFIAALLIRHSFGGGDIKMMAAAGLFLGLDKTIIAGLIAFLIAGSYGVYLLFTKKRGAKEKVKLAPYLALGCAFSELFGDVFLEIFRTFF
jgi:leader peptidase (prepilin peptidase)/N-methyltransferase